MLSYNNLQPRVHIWIKTVLRRDVLIISWFLTFAKLYHLNFWSLMKAPISFWFYYLYLLYLQIDECPVRTWGRGIVKVGCINEKKQAVCYLASGTSAGLFWKTTTCTTTNIKRWALAEFCSFMYYLGIINWSSFTINKLTFYKMVVSVERPSEILYLKVVITL